MHLCGSWSYVTHIRLPLCHLISKQERKTRPGQNSCRISLPATGGAGHTVQYVASRSKITRGVGTMWCAYVFAALALIGLPNALSPHGEGIIAWILRQTFLQLVLLSIIIVGQNIQSLASDKRAEATYEDADAVLHTAQQIQTAPRGPRRRARAHSREHPREVRAAPNGHRRLGQSSSVLPRGATAATL